MLTKWNKVLHFLHFMNILSLNHVSEEVVNFVFAASKITTFDEVVGLLSPSTGWCVQFEWPQEIGSIFEVWSNCHYFVHQVFNANDSKLAQSSFDYIIACNWSAFAIDLN